MKKTGFVFFFLKSIVSMCLLEISFCFESIWENTQTGEQAWTPVQL